MSGGDTPVKTSREKTKPRHRLNLASRSASSVEGHHCCTATLDSSVGPAPSSAGWLIAAIPLFGNVTRLIGPFQLGGIWKTTPEPERTWGPVAKR
ncbi:hypothetical protein EYF80_041006 [Liparis tanakae]|uniref:Uncharacterized protein n=1 Tax=Liparis tanakae TaxID=230148 RepID=A0A4Z2G5A5_9TELE|nr:hypothetical protein EYF80_041006 [Liparis tanakae]